MIVSGYFEDCSVNSLDLLDDYLINSLDLMDSDAP